MTRNGISKDREVLVLLPTLKSNSVETTTFLNKEYFGRIFHSTRITNLLKSNDTVLKITTCTIKLSS